MDLPLVFLRMYMRMRRSMLLGARVAAIDAQGRVLLVHQTYATSWILPGGGVERGETVEQAAIRELREEANVVTTTPMQFHGFFSNDAALRGDHLAVFVTREFETHPFTPTREIKAAQFFAPDRLPDGMDEGSRRRIHEIVNNTPLSPLW
jgi:ADP-ribose pyrophosphatase YjhB (NUDIX family)